MQINKSGNLPSDEVLQLVHSLANVTDTDAGPTPLVVTIGLHSSQIHDVLTPSRADDLEARLIFALRRNLKRPIVQTEASLRTGETMSVRVALWDIDIDRLVREIHHPWELLEVSNFEDIYDQDPHSSFRQAVDETYNIFRAERQGCPVCGGRVAVTGFSSETGEYAIGTCETCGWEEYHS